MIKMKKQNANSGTNLLLVILVVVSMLSLALFVIDTNRLSVKSSRKIGLSRDIHNENARDGNLSMHVERIKNPPQQSKFCYVTLISGINKSFRYRGFLYNALIMKRALKQTGSTADFIALIGYSDDGKHLYESDLNLLRSNGIIVHELPRLLDSNSPLTFAEMALLKITPWSFYQYDRVQFFDGDVMPTKNMDCFFQLDANAFTVGAVSPLNSGWYLAIPNQDDFEFLRKKAIWRLNCNWNEEIGWADPISGVDLTYRGGTKKVMKWDFNGADMDQGLLTHYFIMHKGNALLVDTEIKQARKFGQLGSSSKPARAGLLHVKDAKIPMHNALSCCNGMIPTSFFVHFTGRSKPWMIAAAQAANTNKNIGRDLRIWLNHLDALRLSVNSTNINSLGLGSPLGFFNANFPKRDKTCVPL